MSDKSLLPAIARSFKAALTKSQDTLIDATTQKMATITSDVLGGLAGDIFSKFFGEFVKSLLKALSGSEDAIADIRKKVSKIIEEPLKTGLTQLSQAEATPAKDPEQASHRTLRFQQALNNLDRAYSHASSDEERSLVSLLRGLASLNLPGGHSEALRHFEAFEITCVAIKSGIRERVASEKETARTCEEKAAQIIVPAGTRTYGAGRGLIGSDYSFMRAEKAELLSRARKCHARATELEEELRNLEDTSSAVSALTGMQKNL